MKTMKKILSLSLAIIFTTGLSASIGYATHSWNVYHWARQINPFTLKLGDNVSSAWDNYLGETSTDWSVSTILDTTIVAGGTNPKQCKPTAGQVEVCNSKYGRNGWLGIAQIWVSDTHITKGITKMNDTYFNMATYNTPAWRRFVMCQEIGHTFGLDHQDENFNNANLGSCMDYTNDPDGGAGGAVSNDPSNEHPNTHDYEQLGIIYTHTDNTSTISPSFIPPQSAKNINGTNHAEWGKALRMDKQGRPSLYERDLGNNQKIFTFVLYVE